VECILAAAMAVMDFQSFRRHVLFKPGPCLTFGSGWLGACRSHDMGSLGWFAWRSGGCSGRAGRAVVLLVNNGCAGVEENNGCAGVEGKNSVDGRKETVWTAGLCVPRLFRAVGHEIWLGLHMGLDALFP